MKDSLKTVTKFLINLPLSSLIYFMHHKLELLATTNPYRPKESLSYIQTYAPNHTKTNPGNASHFKSSMIRTFPQTSPYMLP